MRLSLLAIVALLWTTSGCLSLKILISNDDSWATANIRAMYYAARRAGHDALISAPAMQQSGKGRLMREPVPLDHDGEFGAVKKGAPAEGHDSKDDHIWYVNSTPVSSVKYGIEILSPRFFDGPPDIVLTGFNQGFNLGLAYLASGTYSAAEYAVLHDIPGFAFSSGNKEIRPYTDLTEAEDQANIYAEMTMDLLSHLQSTVTSGQPLLPSKLGLNVNFPDAVKRRCTASESKWTQTRLLATINKSPDACLCGQINPCKLPTESTIERGSPSCTNSITVFEPRLYDPDAKPAYQDIIAKRLANFTSCL